MCGGAHGSRLSACRAPLPLPPALCRHCTQVDTEGLEAAVLLEGAIALLRAHRIQSVLWEYSDKTSPDIFTAVKKKRGEVRAA